MSTPISNRTDDRLPTPTMFAPTMCTPPRARAEAREAVVAARGPFSTLPPAPRLNTRRRRDKPFEDDLVSARQRERLDPATTTPLAPRERPSLDPVVMPPPPGPLGASVGVLTRVLGAIGLAALAAFFMAGMVQATPV